MQNKENSLPKHTIRRCAHVTLLFCLGLLLVAASAEARFTIRNYRSDVTVHADGTLLVRETFLAEMSPGTPGSLYRDIPTVDRDNGWLYRANDFRVIDVRKDGQPERYRLEKLTNGIRLRLGEKSSGNHQYLLRYRTDGIFEHSRDSDALILIIASYAKDSTIDKPVVTVTPPSGTSTEQVDVWERNDMLASVDNVGRAHFTHLDADSEFESEGPDVCITIFPFGIVKQPKSGQFTGTAYCTVLGCLLLLYIYYTRAKLIRRTTAPDTGKLGYLQYGLGLSLVLAAIIIGVTWQPGVVERYLLPADPQEYRLAPYLLATLAVSAGYAVLLGYAIPQWRTRRSRLARWNKLIRGSYILMLACLTLCGPALIVWGCYTLLPLSPAYACYLIGALLLHMRAQRSMSQAEVTGTASSQMTT